MRYLEEFLLKDLKKQMVLLSGPRQCGKTTLSRHLLKKQPKGEYLNWDQIKDRKKITQQDWSDDTSLLVLDEIHKKKLWKNFLKGIYDTKRDAMQMLITGSARLELFQKSGDSMLGRYRPWRLHPFCLGEDPLGLSVQDRYQRMLTRGGFPAPYLASDLDDVQKWRNQRWSLLLREDVRDIGVSVKDLNGLELMAELLKKYAGGMLSYSNIAEDVEVAPKTAKAWISVLEKIYMVFLITPYSKSIKRSISKTPKLYFVDQGDLADNPLGTQIENLVALNLLKRLHFIEDAYGDRVTLHYVRDKSQREVDFLIAINRNPVALIEVKTSYEDPSPALIDYAKKLEIKNVIQLHTEHKVKTVIKKGVRILALQHFFSTPLSTRKFWEPLTHK